MIPALLSVYVAVLGAEIVGDKTLYTVGSLAARHRVGAVVAGASAAAAGKMAVAAYLGQALSRLPPRMLVIVSAATFVGLAVSVWWKRPRGAAEPAERTDEPLKAAGLAFAGIFFTEWADPGQLAAALLSAKLEAPALVLAGATAAMVTKILIAVTVGASLRRRVPETALRLFTTAVCVVMGVLTAFQVEI